MIILTGASGGVGKNLIPLLVEMDEVLGIYNRTAPDIEGSDRLHFEKVDISNSAEVQSFVEKWKSKLSKVTLAHFAAAKIDGISMDYSEDNWKEVMDVNLTGNFLLTKALTPVMMKDSWGRIIHVSSLGGQEGAVGTASYSASKAGLLGLSRVFAKEYARFHITSNTITLGYFDFGLISSLNEKERKSIQSRIPSKNFGSVSDIANAIQFLINSEYVNGSEINIDGGI